MKTILCLLWQGLKLFFILPFAMLSGKVFDAFWRKYFTVPMPKSVFNLCVQWLLYYGKRYGFSYERINVYIFCVIWPLITIVSIVANIVLLILLLDRA